jgi:hypothetical protein
MLCSGCKAEIPPQRVLRDGSGNCYCAACWANQILAVAAGASAANAAETALAAVDLTAPPAPPTTQAAAPATPAAQGPVRLYTCTFCQIQVREADVRFFHGEVACPACHFNKSADEQSPMETCAECGAVVASDLLVSRKGRKLCAECAEEKRISGNRKNREVRSMLQAARGTIVTDVAARRGPWWASIVGAALVIAILGVIAYFVIGGLNGPARAPMYTVIDRDGNQVELRQTEARQRLLGDSDLTLYKDGTRMPRDEALKLLGE